MIKYMMHASNNKFMIAILSVLSLAVIQSDWCQLRFKPFNRLRQVIAQTQANISNPAVDVQLKIQIKEQRYCRSTTANHNILQMVLSVDFINTGKDRLIFFKHGHRIAEYTLSRTEEDALAKKYESHGLLYGTNQFLDDITSLIDTQTPSAAFFIIIPPGEVYRSEERLSIPIYVNENTQQPENLPEGEHFLQIALVTWPDIDAQPEKLREQWKEYGHLYYKAATSAPVSFQFLHNTKTEPCSR